MVLAAAAAVDALRPHAARKAFCPAPPALSGSRASLQLGPARLALDGRVVPGPRSEVSLEWGYAVRISARGRPFELRGRRCGGGWPVRFVSRSALPAAAFLAGRRGAALVRLPYDGWAIFPATGRYRLDVLEGGRRIASAVVHIIGLDRRVLAGVGRLD